MNAHAPHQGAHMLATDVKALALSLIATHARTHIRMRNMQFINSMHQRQVRRTDGLSLVVRHATAETEQLSLTADADMTVPVNHFLTREPIPFW